MPKDVKKVRVSIDGQIATVTIDNPPVNALSQAVRAGLLDAFDALARESSVEAIVLCCAGRSFIVGADISEFGKPSADPQLPDVVDRIEQIDRPVIAALHGAALGGGFEIALGCHYRLAAPGTKVGLPEVTLGLIPGAGACYRLPRLVGVADALSMIAGGAPIDLETAVKRGAIDLVVAGDLTEAAKAYAAQLIESRSGVRRLCDDDGKIITFDRSVFLRQKMALKPAKRGQIAPDRAVDAVELGVTLPLAQARIACRKIFLELRESRQAAALRRLFFAEREIGDVPGLSADIQPAEIKSAAVIGAGAMGAGIATCFANAGIPATLLDVSQDNVERGLASIREIFDDSFAKGKVSADHVRARIGMIRGATDFEEAADADLVIEAVFEDLDVKKDVMRRLDAVCKPETILATNTSYLDIDEIAAATERPDQVIGLHFFNPAHIMPLLEIIRARRTSGPTLCAATNLAKRLRKTGVVAGVCFGFIGNRMLNAYRTEALRIALEGNKIADIDRALYDFGMPMGPFALMDLTGLDVNVKMRAQAADGIVEKQAFAIVDRLYAMGRRGQRFGGGFYNYAEGLREAIDNPSVDGWIGEEAAKLGISPRGRLSDTAIVDRCMLTLANEGARILDEGVAIRAGDIDVVYVSGYGFPRHIGGPLCWAEQEGLVEVRARLTQYHDQFRLPRWRPSDLIERAAAAGRSLDEAIARNRRA